MRGEMVTHHRTTVNVLLKGRVGALVTAHSGGGGGTYLGRRRHNVQEGVWLSRETNLADNVNLKVQDRLRRRLK